MKKTMFGIGLTLALMVPLLAVDKEEDRVKNAGTVMQEILKSSNGIPQNVLDKAECVVVLPSVKKVALGFGGSYGRGVMTCRGGSNFQGAWGAPTMMALEGASFGLQLGGNATDFVLLLMSPTSARNVLKSQVKLGGDATAAAGPVGRTASAETDATLHAEILSYSRAKGLFAGVSLEGSTLRADGDANKKLYGKEVSAESIVFNNAVTEPESAKLLIISLQQASPTNKSN
jgi:SH3 domain-containing YSC84-like protein 1